MSASRRDFTALLGSLLFWSRRGSAQGQSPAPRPVPAAKSRTYRADALILLLGLTIYKRPNVGGGQASIAETGEGASLRRTYFFAGGSDPKRARGLSRLGWMRESVTGAAGTPTQIDYFGVLTSSPEESLEGARKTVAAPPSGRSIFSAANGRHTAARTRSAVTHFEYGSDAVWSDRGLIERAEATFGEKADWRETARPESPNAAPATFLCELAVLLQQRARRAAGRYIYCEQEYELELEAAAPDRDRLLPVRGKIRNLRTRKETPFRVWLDEASILPVRIEFQPRSFLRLTFEAVSGV